MTRCFCACHEYPGTYRPEPCGYCGHFNSKGRMPGSVRDGWEPDHVHDWTPYGFSACEVCGGMAPTDICRGCGAAQHPFHNHPPAMPEPA